MACNQNTGDNPEESETVSSTLWASVTALRTTVVSVPTLVSGQDTKLGEQKLLAQVVSTLEETTEQLSSTIVSKVVTIERDL
jgi:hypothetical protein